MKTQPFQGRTVLITGASAGIGRAAAKRFARAGAGVVLAARRAAELEDAAREVTSPGVRVPGLFDRVARRMAAAPKLTKKDA